jgi:hypothetical protein
VKTIFVCKALNLRVEGLDHRVYTVNEQITLKYQGRWLPMIVDEVVDEGGIRQVILRPSRALEPVVLREPRTEMVASAGPSTASDWIAGLVGAIQGKKGPVRW